VASKTVFKLIKYSGDAEWVDDVISKSLLNWHKPAYTFPCSKGEIRLVMLSESGKTYLPEVPDGA